MNKFKIQGVAKGSIFEEMKIEKGDVLLSINQTAVADFMDYRYLIADENLLVEIEKQNGEIWELEIEKEFEEDLGVEFTENMIETRTCKNNCIFCFIDQMPPGMRETLYVKDDDERLSFLMGNYITLTNLTEEEIERIIRYRIMPINISIHTTNSELRCKMLNNRFAGTIMASLKHFAETGIEMNGQIVLCPGYNDGEELKRTISDLMCLYPQLISVSVVPVGISKYREGLIKLDKFDQKGAKKTLEIIEVAQKKMQVMNGTHFIYASDEFFLLAGKPLPEGSYYDGFPQIENGVGMMTDFKETLEEAFEKEFFKNEITKRIGIITGCLAANFMYECASAVKIKYPKLEIDVYAIKNHFFGENITVSGLITGTDIIDQVEKNHKVDYYLMPENMVRKDTYDLLDDYRVKDLEKILQAEIRIVPVDGNAFLHAMLD
ncbi:MAG: DUF512 domain-containing protein [Eubacterium sp.]